MYQINCDIVIKTRSELAKVYLNIFPERPAENYYCIDFKNLGNRFYVNSL